MTSAPFQVHITHPQHTAQYQPDEEEEEIAKNRRSKGELYYGAIWKAKPWCSFQQNGGWRFNLRFEKTVRLVLIL